MQTTDFLVVGGGIIGVNVARELKRRYSDAQVTLLEKEPELGRHASGRNSGILHAGFYYTADSLKARFAREGNLLLRKYCESRDLPVNAVGKLVVARNDKEDQILDELLERAHKNGVILEIVASHEAHEIEPRAIVRNRALYSPTTAAVDPRELLRSMEEDAQREGVIIQHNVAYLSRARNGGVITSGDRISSGYLVNTAGLYADRVARDFGFSRHYRILPFKGLYLQADTSVKLFQTNIYPVPDLKNPFLGVHVTVPVNGQAKLGPTAIPAFWREQYNGYKNFRLGEFLDISWRMTGLFINSKFEFKRLSWQEIQKYSRHKLIALASELARGIEERTFRQWAQPGIRAQLVNTETRRLEMDFVLEGNDKSLHILNAVSPGLTCSIPFSRYVCDEIRSNLS